MSSIGKYKNFMDSHFQILIDNILPGMNTKYLKEVENGVNVDFETITVLSKLKKYQKEEFIAEHGLNEIEVGLANLDLNEEQFNLFVKSYLLRDRDLKQTLGTAIKDLVKIKESIIKAMIDLLASRAF
jgi:translation elongation factor EF-G